MEGRPVAQAICRSQSEGNPGSQRSADQQAKTRRLRDQGVIDVEESGREKAKALAV
jgi:hypothetical protein